MQQTVKVEPSLGQSASLSTLSQKNTDRPLVQSPLHGFNGTGFGLVVVVVVDDGGGCLVIIVVVVVVIIVEKLVESGVFGRVVIGVDEVLLYAPLLCFSSLREEFSFDLV